MLFLLFKAWWHMQNPPHALLVTGHIHAFECKRHQQGFKHMLTNSVCWFDCFISEAFINGLLYEKINMDEKCLASICLGAGTKGKKMSNYD